VAYGGQCNWIYDVVTSQYDFILMQIFTYIHIFDADIHIYV